MCSIAACISSSLHTVEEHVDADGAAAVPDSSTRPREVAARRRIFGEEFDCRDRLVRIPGFGYGVQPYWKAVKQEYSGVECENGIIIRKKTVERRVRGQKRSVHNSSFGKRKWQSNEQLREPNLGLVLWLIFSKR